MDPSALELFRASSKLTVNGKFDRTLWSGLMPRLTRFPLVFFLYMTGEQWAKEALNRQPH